MPKEWLIGDTHFGHTNIIKYCSRPLDADMQMIQNWSWLVEVDDSVIHLGDVVLGPDQEEWYRTVFTGLPGRKTLIKGNHDKRSNKYFLEHGWSLVANVLMRPYKDSLWRKIYFTHMPLNLELGEYANCALNVHGHSHNSRPRGVEVSPKHRLFSIEYENYKPVELSEFLRRENVIEEENLPN